MASYPISCDYPICIGGECEYECERLDKHRLHLKEQRECATCPPADAIADERRCPKCPWRAAQ
jgi:hypothetical protein